MKILNATRFTDGVFAELEECQGFYPGDLWSNWPDKKEKVPDLTPWDRDWETT